jgi:NAD(P)-dependent dehydrogenase (short-subunit alcohol dehydrogenase family)
MTTDVLVVTGGASGIGRACAEAMAGTHDKVALVDLNTETLAVVIAEMRASGIEVEGYEADVSDAEGLVALADRIERELGPVKTLVASAGILNNSDTVMEMDLGEHARVWDINYNGTVYTVRAFARAMIERRAGAILTIGSINSFAALPLPAYCPSKTAILRLTEILAVELGRHGIRINGVAPTYVLTPALKARIDAGQRDPDAIRVSGALEMFVYPEHIAQAASFLCSDQAAAITGSMLPVDAGWQAATSYRSYVGGVPWEANE